MIACLFLRTINSPRLTLRDLTPPINGMGTRVVLFEDTKNEEMVFISSPKNIHGIVVESQTRKFLVNVSASDEPFPYARFYFVRKLKNDLYWAQYQHLYLFDGDGKLIRTENGILFDYIDGGTPNQSKAVTITWDAQCVFLSLHFIEVV